MRIEAVARRINLPRSPRQPARNGLESTEAWSATNGMNFDIYWTQMVNSSRYIWLGDFVIIPLRPQLWFLPSAELEYRIRAHLHACMLSHFSRGARTSLTK